jgi:hypothetical protein
MLRDLSSAGSVGGPTTLRSAPPPLQVMRSGENEAKSPSSVNGW